MPQDDCIAGDDTIARYVCMAGDDCKVENDCIEEGDGIAAHSCLVEDRVGVIVWQKMRV